jgi:hypothetical protein
MPKGVKKLEYEIADWKHYKMKGTWLDGRKPYKTFTHSDADDHIKKLEKLLVKAKERERERPYEPDDPQEQDGGRRKSRRRRGTRSTRRR